MPSRSAPSFQRAALVAMLALIALTVFKRISDRRGSPASEPARWPPFEQDGREAGAVERGASVRRDRMGTDAASSPVEAWVAPPADGVAPDGYPVKVKVSSGIFHVPGGRFYERTVADRCYPSAAAAEADGYRPSKN